MNSLDLATIFIYLVIVFGIAIASRKSNSDDIDEQYLAGRDLTFWESLCSIVATETSALTFLGIPAIAFNSNFSFIQIYIGALFGRIIIAKVFVPKIYGKGITVYQIMAGDDDAAGGQRVTASFYFVAKVLAVGVRLFSGSILVAEFFDLNIYLAVAVICLLTVVYTMIGGLKAVARTDIMQMLLFVAGGLAAHYYIPHYSGESWSFLMEKASLAGKTHWFALDSSFLIGVLGGFIFDLATHGVDQDFTQRLMANRTIGGAKKAIFFSSFFSISIGFLFLGVGTLLWSYYQIRMLPEGIKPDYLFAHFITNYFPSPLKGMMVAGVLAATMSTLDSTINALSSTLFSDIFPNRDAKLVKKIAKVDTIIVTVLLFLVALFAATSDSLLLLGLKVVSWTGGSLLALFLCRLIFPARFKAPLTATCVFGTFAVGIFSVYLNTFHLNLAWQFNVYFGCISSIVFQQIYIFIRKASNS